MTTIVIETNIEEFPTAYGDYIECTESGILFGKGDGEQFLLLEDIKSITIKNEGEES